MLPHKHKNKASTGPEFGHLPRLEANPEEQLGKKRPRVAAAAAVEEVRKRADFLEGYSDEGGGGEENGSSERDDEVGLEGSRKQSRTGPEKPNKPFSALIKEVILASPHKRLLLHEIYDAIIQAYPYFQTAGEGWKNSVRHNLSINTMFCKIPRDMINDLTGVKDDAVVDQVGKATKKKGCYWILRDVTCLGRTGPDSSILLNRRKSLSNLRPSTSLYSSSGRVNETLAGQVVAIPPKPFTPSITIESTTGDKEETVKVTPFVRVPKLVDIGRRYSDSFLESGLAPKKPVSIQELRQDWKEKTQQLGSRATSHYATSLNKPTTWKSGKSPSIYELQPLPFDEENQLKNDLSWWGPAEALGISTLEAPRRQQRRSKDDSYLDYNYSFMSEIQQQNQQQQPWSTAYSYQSAYQSQSGSGGQASTSSSPGKIKITNEKGIEEQFTIPTRRNIMDVWLGEGSRSPPFPG